jgi:GNAT superfamily N-acetyltransferase
VTDHDREPLVIDGRQVLTFVRTTRDGLDAADLVEPEPGIPLDEVADAVLAAFPGWAVSAPPDLGRVLLDRGSTTIRHAHWLSRDLVADPPDPAWASLEPGDHGLRVGPASLVAEDYLDATEAAYPPDHPDHEPRESPADRLAKDVTPLLDGTYGHYLDESMVVRAQGPRGTEGRVVAACIVVDRPSSGPWVVDVFRRPEAEYAGLGTLLLQRCMATLAAAGYPTLALAVTDANTRARRTYARLGFRLVLESLTVKAPQHVE